MITAVQLIFCLLAFVLPVISIWSLLDDNGRLTPGGWFAAMILTLINLLAIIQLALWGLGVLS